MAGYGRNEAFLQRMRDEKERRRRRRWVGLGLVAAVLGYVIVFGDAGWLAVRDAEREVLDKEAEIESVEQQTAADQAALEALRVEGGEALEATARELYRMQKPGEEIHHLLGSGDDEESPGSP